LLRVVVGQRRVVVIRKPLAAGIAASKPVANTMRLMVFGSVLSPGSSLV
jgi:hypothetical protein